MKTIRIEVSPEAVHDEIIDAGVMFEHNATQLEFALDEEYLQPDYKYYIEFSMPSGTARSEYLEPDENSVITFLLPDTVTSQMAVLCYFNIIKINEETYDTELVIKPVQLRLSFESVASTDSALAREYSFSVNALLQAIENGDFVAEVADGSITNEKLADGAVSYEKFDETLNSMFLAIEDYLGILIQDAEFKSNKSNTLQSGLDNNKYPTVNAVRSFLSDNIGAFYRPQLIKDVTLENSVSEFVVDALPSTEDFECKELFLQLDAPAAESENAVKFYVRSREDTWQNVAGQTNDLKIYATASKHTFMSMHYSQYEDRFWKCEYGLTGLSATFSFDGLAPCFALKTSSGNSSDFNADGVTGFKIIGALPAGTKIRLWGTVKKNV
jgi:hypothetical protein